MPHPSWPSERAPVPSKRNTGYRNEGAGVVHDETERRKDETTIAAAAQQPSGSGGGGGNTAVPRPPPPPEAPKPGPDRLHKRAVSKDWGGYIYVSHDHDDISEDSELPPTNPAYRGPGVVASSIADAYAYAASRMNTMRAGSRVAIVPIAGRWSEDPLTIAIPGIDMIGHGRPSLDMGIFVGGMGDASFETLDMRTTGDVIPLTLQPTAPAPGALRTPSLTGCRLYAEGRAMVALQQFAASDCTFEQTSNVHGLDDAHAVVDVQFQPPWPGVALMRGCTLRSWTTLPDMVSVPDIGVVPLDGHPGGYAIRIAAMAAGPFGSNDINNTLAFEWPSNQVVLDDCAVYGSAFVDQWQLEHIGGHVHGAYPVGRRSGTIYAVLRGRPLFNESNGFYANVPGHVMFDGTRIFAEEIATGLPFNGAYPVGVTPSTYPGLVYVQASGAQHFGRWDGGAASAFHPIGGAGPIGVFDVANTPTSAAAWITGGWNAGTGSTDGACPVSVRANKRFYLM